MRDLCQSVGLRPEELQGQVAVVTGGGRGIGRAVAEGLAAIGALSVVVDLAEQGAETVAQIRAAGGKALFIQADVADEAAVARLSDQVATAFGPVSLLINNAAIIPVAKVTQMELALWDRVMAVNLRGSFLLSRAFLPGMQATGRGVLVNMVSTEAMPGLSAYIASKQGMAGLTQSLAAELGGTGIYAIALAPGLVESPGLRQAGESLAPLLGMEAAQFFKLSLHPGYEGPMPAAQAGLATAYLVARLAPEYHGELVTGYTILERAGLLRATESAVPEGPARSATAEVPAKSVTLQVVADSTTATVPSGPAVEGPQHKSQAELLHLTQRLAAILAEIASDFDRLPLFVRPLARSGFKGKAGASIQEWQGRGARLQADLAQGKPLDRTLLLSQLEHLLRYVRGVPGETARFSRDPQLLREVQERTDRHEADLLALCQCLKAEQ